MRNIIDVDIISDRVDLVSNVQSDGVSECLINFRTSNDISVTITKDDISVVSVAKSVNGVARFTVDDTTIRASGEFTVFTDGLTPIRFVVEKNVGANAAYMVRASGGALYVRTATKKSSGEDDTRVYLYKDGDGIDELTGGWSETSDGSGVCTIGADGILLETNSTKTRKGVVSNQAVDLTAYSRLFVEFEVLSYSSGKSQIRIGVHTTNSPTVGTSNATSTCALFYPYGDGKMMYSYNIKDINASRFIWASLANATTASIRIYRIWFESDAE